MFYYHFALKHQYKGGNRILLDILLVVLIGLLGGVTHIFMFLDGRFYPPRKIKDESGREFRDLGFLRELFLGVVAAFAATLPVWNDTPTLYKIYAGLMAAVTGSAFIMSANKVFLEKQIKRNKDFLFKMVDVPKDTEEGEKQWKEE